MAMHPFPARYEGRCARCSGPIVPGQLMVLYNRPRPKTPYHETCPGDATQEAAETIETYEENETADVPTPDRPVAILKPTMPTDADAALDRLAEALAARMPPAQATGVDEQQVRALIDRYMADRLPTAIEVRRADETTYRADGAHYLFERVCKLAAAGITLYLWGPAGSGKTTLAIQVAEALGREHELDTLDPSTPKSWVMGYRTPNGDPVDTQFSRSWTLGKVYVADETDNAPAHVQTLYNSALANHHAPLAWGSVKRSDGFLFIGTGNTPGQPTPAFPDRRPMSAAFKDRLYYVYVPLDENIERTAAGMNRKPRAPRTVVTIEPKQWVSWVIDVRAWAEKNAPTLMVTPRASLLGLQALAIGETPAEAADGLVFRGADSALVDKVLSACPLPGA